MPIRTERSRDTEPARITYEPRRGELTGLVRGGPMPSWAADRWGVAWDRPGAWWLDCIVTYENDRVDGVVLAVTPAHGADVLKEAAKVLGRWCVVEAVICNVRPPMDTETILWIQQANAKLTKSYRRAQAT